MAEVLGIVSGIAGLVSLTIELTRTTQRYVVGVRGAPKMWLDLISEAKALRNVLTDLQDSVLENPDIAEAFSGKASVVLSRMQTLRCNPESTTELCYQDEDLVEQCSKDLSLFVEKLKKKTEGKPLSVAIKRFTWPFAEEEFRQNLEMIHRYREMFLMLISIDNFVLNAKTHQVVKESNYLIQQAGDDVAAVRLAEKNKVAAEKRTKMLQWLSPINSYVVHRDLLSKHQEGTGKWYIDSHKYKAWVEGTGETLVSFGMPGAGKTIIAAIVIETLRQKFKENPSIGVCGFFCNYKETELQTPVNILASLYAQLMPLHHSDQLPADFEELYDSHEPKKTRPNLQEMASLLRRELVRRPKAYIVIDALDECPDLNAQQNRFDLVEILQSLMPHFSLLITSRHIDSIAVDFKEAKKLEIIASTHDVQSYVVGRLTRGSRLGRLVARDYSLREKILHVVAEKSRGMFILAHLHMDSLHQKLTAGEIREALQTLPSEITATYDGTLSRIDAQGASPKELAYKILAWVVHAFRPLSVLELRHALAVRPNTTDLDKNWLPEEEDLTSVCAGLVMIDPDKSVRLVHYSTQQYFDRIRRDLFPTAHLDLARVCLTHLGYDVCGRRSPPIPPHELAPHNRFSHLQRYPFIKYLIRYVGLHISEGSEEELKDLILTVLHRPKLVQNFNFLLEYTGRSSSTNYDGVPLDSKEYSALEIAAYYNLPSTVEHFLKNSANTDMDEGISPLDGALRRAYDQDHLSMVEILLGEGADPTAKYDWTDSAFQQAARQGKMQYLSMMFRSMSPSFWHEDDISLAVRSGNVDVVRLLLDNGADVSFYNKKRGSGLKHAVRWNYKKIAELLLDRGADATEDGLLDTAMEACYLNDDDDPMIIRRLIQAGAKVNSIYRFWNIEKQISVEGTALHQAVSYGLIQVANVLVESGADAAVLDGLGRTSQDIARSQSDTPSSKIGKVAWECFEWTAVMPIRLQQQDVLNTGQHNDPVGEISLTIGKDVIIPVNGL